jgi:thioredoxin reductase (NADPH)
MKKTQVTPVLDSVLTSIEGDGKVNQINVKNVVTGESDIIKADGVFIAIGRQPVTELAGKALSMDENGYIITDEEMRTSVDGVFAAGDLRKKTYRQIVTATSDGAIAALSAIHYINSRRS